MIVCAPRALAPTASPIPAAIPIVFIPLFFLTGSVVIGIGSTSISISVGSSIIGSKYSSSVGTSIIGSVSTIGSTGKSSDPGSVVKGSTFSLDGFLFVPPPLPLSVGASVNSSENSLLVVP